VSKQLSTKPKQVQAADSQAGNWRYPVNITLRNARVTMQAGWIHDPLVTGISENLESLVIFGDLQLLVDMLGKLSGSFFVLFRHSKNRRRR
jgi:hypothetical protein